MFIDCSLQFSLKRLTDFPIISFTLTLLKWNRASREKVRTSLNTCSSRSASETIISAYSFCFFSVTLFNNRRPKPPRALRGFRISWATSAVRRPREASFSAWMSLSCVHMISRVFLATSSSRLWVHFSILCLAILSSSVMALKVEETLPISSLEDILTFFSMSPEETRCIPIVRLLNGFSTILHNIMLRTTAVTATTSTM